LTSSNAPSEIFRRYKHYGRRKGPKLSAHKAGLLETLLPHLSLNLQSGSDPKAYFAPVKVQEVWLEVGFGAGEHLVAQAERNPHVGIIGAEPYVAGTAKLLSKIAAQGLQNIRLYQSDAREIIDALPAASASRIFVLFPDPWPKMRHHKRRFISTGMLDQLAGVMRPGAELRFASDDVDYVSWALERFIAHPSFCWLAQTPNDWRVRTDDWPQTRYEAKAKLAGRTCTYLRFERL
jgi:tRNA (guanine-N7-)-methyltransferase